MKQESKFLPLPIWAYIIGWIFFSYLFIQLLSFNVQTQGNLLLSGMSFIDFGVHEASHLIVFFLPSIFVAAAGSIGEMTFPILIVIATIKGKAYFATSFAALWVMLAMHSVGNYMADARSQLLPLIGLGDSVKHDWNYVFGQLGWLNADTAIGGAVSTIGTIVGAAGLAWGVFLIVKKIQLLRKKSVS